MSVTRERAALCVRLLGVFLVYVLLAAAVTYPLVGRLGDGVPHDRADPLLNTWLLFWNAHHLPFTAGWWNGPFFHPIPGVLSFSESLVGLSVLTTPLQWLGASPLAAYNTAFVLSFALCAFAMHLLSLSLGMKPGPCFVAGLAFGFAPYRAGHLAHLQILSAFFIPLVFLGLHRFLGGGRPRWLLLFAAAWGLQGLTNGYYLVFVSVLVVLWLVWFVPPRRLWRRTGVVLLAWALVALALAPVLRAYASWHSYYGFERTIDEISALSADLVGLVSPAPALAHWPAATRQPNESWLFPGLTMPLLVAVFLVAWRRSHRPAEGPAATLFAGVAATAATVAAVTALMGPWRVGIAGLSLSVKALSKPLGLSLYALALAAVSSRALRAAWRRGSVLAFYLIGCVVMVVLALGPAPRAAGAAFWHRAPYWHLLELPGITALRSPARFAMLAVFCLALTGALALGRLVERGGRRGTLLVILAAVAVLWDGWLDPLPILEPPAHLEMLDSDRAAVVLELPIGGERDTSAMYRAMAHAHPVLNGYSGYDPPHYHALRLGLERLEPGLLGALREHGPLLVLLDRTARRAEELEKLVLAEGDASTAGEEKGHRAYVLPRTTPVAASHLGPIVPMTVVSSGRTRAVFELGEPGPIGGVVLNYGLGVTGLSRRVMIEVAQAPPQWTTVWVGPIAALALQAGLRDPQRVPVVLETPGAVGRFLRVRVDGWTIESVEAHRPASASAEAPGRPR